jgi:hypothetical protein
MLEEVMACGISSILQRASDPSLHLLTHLLWSGLQHESKISIENVKEKLFQAMSDRDFADIFGDVFGAFLDDLKQYKILPGDKKKADQMTIAEN